MKKILTLLLATGSFIAVNAQYSDNGNYPSKQGRDVVLGSNGRGSNGSYATYPPSSSYDNGRYEIDKVNREYDIKINSIRNNPYLRHREKERSIRMLEADRQRRIQEIVAYNNSCRKDNDRRKGGYRNNNNRWND